jgi:hypothetical protein
MLVLTSCSKSDDDGGSSSNPLVGTWYTEGEEKGYPTYEEITYNANNTCTWRDYKSDKTTIKETDSGTYKVDGNKLSIWWSGSSTPWTTTFSISGNKMTTSEGGGTVWTKK